MSTVIFTFWHVKTHANWHVTNLFTETTIRTLFSGYGFLEVGMLWPHSSLRWVKRRRSLPRLLVIRILPQPPTYITLQMSQHMPTVNVTTPANCKHTYQLTYLLFDMSQHMPTDMSQICSQKLLSGYYFQDRVYWKLACSSHIAASGASNAEEACPGCS